ncbi:1,3-beta-glucanase, partial [Nocardiopsis sp. NPDC060348]
MRTASPPRPALLSAAASVLTAAALLFPGTASAAPAPEAGAAAAGAETAQAAQSALVWSDEFDGPAGTAPNPAHWNHETGDHGWGNNEL